MSLFRALQKLYYAIFPFNDAAILSFRRLVCSILQLDIVYMDLAKSVSGRISMLVCRDYTVLEQKLLKLHIYKTNISRNNYVLVLQASNREVVQRLHSTVPKWGAEQIDICDCDIFSTAIMPKNSVPKACSKRFILLKTCYCYYCRR